MKFFWGTSVLAVIGFAKLPSPLNIQMVCPIVKAPGEFCWEFEIVRFNGSVTANEHQGRM